MGRNVGSLDRTLRIGIGTAMVLFTVPLSFTIPDVSIPFIQLLMRGDILIIAPVVLAAALQRSSHSSSVWCFPTESCSISNKLGLN